VAPRTAARLHLRTGGLVEFPNPDGPALRAWARADPDLPDDVCALGASGLDILGVRPGALLEVRAIVPIDG